MNRRYLEYRDGRYMIGKEDCVAGRICWDDSLDKTNFDYYFQIDGSKIRIEEFVEMLHGVESWNFKFELIDPSDEVD